MKTWVCDSEQKVEIFIPFLGKYRPLTGRCCQTCTPRSWVSLLLVRWRWVCLSQLVWANLQPFPLLCSQDGFYHAQLSSLGFRNATQVTEEDTR